MKRKPILRHLVILLLLLLTTTGIRSSPASAEEIRDVTNKTDKDNNMKAFDYDDLQNGNVKEYINTKTLTTGTNHTYSIKNFISWKDFNTSKTEIKVSNAEAGKTGKTTIDIKEKCDKKDKDSPYRYHFFFDLNKLATPNSTHWHGERD